jgi:hypothetical protein
MKKIHKVDVDRLVKLFVSMGYTIEHAKLMAKERLS